MEFSGEIRDPIHGLIPVNDLELKVIDTEPFQRLRRIKQLAMACLGFPGALHTRFEHCLGTMHVAYKIALHLDSTHKLGLVDSDLQLIRLTGLLHDIGHGPFSHVSEYLLAEYYEGKQEIEEIHEEISGRIITSHAQILGVVGPDLAQDIARVLKSSFRGNYMHDIVSGPLDADKMDYLLRDSYYAGVQYGMFDLDRLINVLSLSKDRRLAVKHEGIEAVEQYVLAKHFISRQVYQHKIRRVTDLMIVQGIISGMEADENLNKLYRYDEDDSYLSFYLEYDDESIQYIMRNIDDMSNIGWQYFDMLRRRILLKELYQEKFKLVARESQESARKFEEITRGGPAELLDEISQVAGLSREFTYVDTFSLKVPPQAKRDRFYDDEESILVTRPDGSTGMLKDDSTIFHSMISDAAEPVISVYGIPRNEKAEIDRDMIRKKVDDILVGYFRRT